MSSYIDALRASIQRETQQDDLTIEPKKPMKNKRKIADLSASSSSGHKVKKVKKPKMTAEEKEGRKLVRQAAKRQYIAEHGPLPKKPRIKKVDLAQKAQELAAHEIESRNDIFTQTNVIKTLTTHPIYMSMLNQLTFSKSTIELDLVQRAQILENQLYTLAFKCRTNDLYQIKLKQFLFNFAKNGSYMIAKYGSNVNDLLTLGDDEWSQCTDIERKRESQAKRNEQYQILIKEDEARDKEFIKKLLPDEQGVDHVVCRFCRGKDKNDASIIHSVDWDQKQTRSADEAMTVFLICRNPTCGRRSRYS